MFILLTLQYYFSLENVRYSFGDRQKQLCMSEIDNPFRFRLCNCVSTALPLRLYKCFIKAGQTNRKL